MDYSQLQRKLIRILSGSKQDVDLPDSDISLLKMPFHSEVEQRALTIGESADGRNSFFKPTSVLANNQDFYIPVFRPEGEKASKSAIILLHGLNERTWDKYLSWGHTLAANTGKSVLLFPLAYHMNRSPESWMDPRNMNLYVQRRLRHNPKVRELSVANVALSERLSRQPQRLFLSGYQAAADLVQLCKTIKSGEHELFDKDASIDFFAYSISVFLSQILMIANPDNLYGQSRFFFFCGGSVLSAVHGVSKYILDSTAFESVRSYYNRNFERQIAKGSLFSLLINDTNLGSAFRSMLSFDRLRAMQREFFQRAGEQIQAVTLRRDKVIPSQLVSQTMNGAEVKEWDFKYNYSHENPFPLLSLATKRPAVDKAFDSLFDKASNFLS